MFACLLLLASGCAFREQGYVPDVSVGMEYGGKSFSGPEWAVSVPAGNLSGPLTLYITKNDDVAVPVAVDVSLVSPNSGLVWFSDASGRRVGNLSIGAVTRLKDRQSGVFRVFADRVPGQELASYRAGVVFWFNGSVLRNVSLVVSAG